MSYGQFNVGTDQDEFNSISFLIDQAILQLQTTTLVKVVGVHGAGLAPTGTVDVQPLVNQMAIGPNGTRTAVPHGIIYGIPFFRSQGGGSAIICDPVVGDIGKCAFASRDISSVKATKAVANPGSQRVYDWSDGLYLGGYLNGTPTQYIQMLAAGAGIEVKTPGTLTVDAAAVSINAPTDIDGNLDVEGTGHFTGTVTMDMDLHVMGSITAGVEVSAPIISTADLIVPPGGSVSVPSGSIPGSALTPSGVTAGSYTNMNATVNAEGLVTAASNGSSSGAPLTTKGDLFGYTTVDARVPVGTDGQILTADSTVPAGLAWKSAGGGGGVPSTIANLIYWFQANLITSAFLPFLPNSNPGLTLYSPSESGNGATGNAGTLNSLPVVSFPGTSDSTYVFPGGGFILHKATIFVVNKPTIVGGTGQCFCVGASGSLEFDINTTGHLEIVKSLIVILGSSTTALTSGAWFQGNVTYNDTTGAYAFRVAQAAAGSGTNVQTITANNTTIGTVPGFGFYLNGQVAEIIIYNRDLSPTEIATVEGYLHTKWGV